MRWRTSITSEHSTSTTTSRSSPPTTSRQVDHRDGPTGLGSDSGMPRRLNIRVIRWVCVRQVDHVVDVHRGHWGTAITASARILAAARADDFVVCTQRGKVGGPEAGGRRCFGR
jgi:hypothetical protein